MNQTPWGVTTLERLLAAAPLASLVVDRSATICFAGGPSASLLGYPSGVLTGVPVTRVLPQWGDGRSVTGRQLARRHDGATVPVEVTLVDLGADDPSGAGALTGIHLADLTGQVLLEQENDDLRDELVGNISHELRTPLTSVVGYLELALELGDDQIGPEARRLLEIVERNARRELRLVDDLLTVTFEVEQLSRMRRDDVDLTDVAARVVAGHQAFAHGAGLEVTAYADGPAVVRGDEGRLARVLEHLVTNACKFSPPGGRVRVEVVATDATVTVTVADNGIGLSRTERERLFERFYRAPGTMARNVEGTGVGLCVVKAVVEAHAGSIYVDSEVGRGTTVRVVLPRTR
jgi:signal transduction histidine kinase